MGEYKERVKKLWLDKDNTYFIHYSCQNLSDDNEGYSPRITSIAVLHLQSKQMYSFSMHLVAEELNIDRESIFEHYDIIEEKMLENFFAFAAERGNAANWIHWNMTNINFGFETLEHRYKVLSQKTAYHINENNRHNISKIIRKIYGDNYAKDPKMLNLMELNGGRDRNFLTGEEEVRAYKAKEFVKLHNSTMCKVYFFSNVFGKMYNNKLRTENNQLKYKINELYQSPVIQILGVIGIIGTLVSLIPFLLTLLK
ncbi:hypothetical protein [Paenibacillus thalictri]|uniref:Uncharacterized protein n=1 Tax=Paenibacillus thalictri TaxID=2527873 RepID=A0A4Q9DRU4_9BACL|nr:hypothetical protein [Paenibacillus thalictri]TBL77887.1 hypothetical protein EYB31_17295 [Paenibacillus thalictri]